MEGAQRRRQAAVARTGHADPQPAAEHAAQRGDRVAAALGRGQRRPGVRQQRLSRAGEAHAALVAVEERLAELALQAADLRADRRLRDRHADGRPRELALLGHGDEVRELAEVHKRSLC